MVFQSDEKKHFKVRKKYINYSEDNPGNAQSKKQDNSISLSYDIKREHDYNEIIPDVEVTEMKIESIDHNATLHTLHTAENMTPFVCEECGVKFNKKSTLQDHMRRKHRIERYVLL